MGDYPIRVFEFLDTSTTDVPGFSSCVLFLWGCNFHCPFCHNKACFDPTLCKMERTPEIAETILNQELVDAVSITGGEPTMDGPALQDLLYWLRVGSEGLYISLDTNGYFPTTLASVLHLVNRVAMDFKAPPQKYDIVTGSYVDWRRIQQSLDLLISANETAENDLDVEFRTTITPTLHSIDEIHQMGKYLAAAGYTGKYVLTQYIQSPGVGATYAGKFVKPTEEYLETAAALIADLGFQVAIRTQAKGTLSFN